MVDDTSTTEDEAFELDLDEETSLEEALEDAVASVGGDEPTAAAEGGDGRDAEFAALEATLAETRDRLARTLADFENYRKRVEREKAEQRRYAVLEPLLAFLEVADNIQRAMEAPGSAEDLKKGLEMTVRGIDPMLARFGAEPIEALGSPFDPNLHEAVGREERDVAAPTVVAEYQRGYRLYDRLLRPSRVVVAVPAQSAENGAEGDGR